MAGKYLPRLQRIRPGAAKSAYVWASKDGCKDWVSGYWPDAWGWRSLVKDSRNGNYTDEFGKMLVALKEGHRHRYLRVAGDMA